MSRTLANIATHFDQLMPVEEQERIGATTRTAADMRVMRALSHYDDMRNALRKIQLSYGVRGPDDHPTNGDGGDSVQCPECFCPFCVSTRALQG